MPACGHDKSSPPPRTPHCFVHPSTELRRRTSRACVTPHHSSTAPASNPRQVMSHGVTFVPSDQPKCLAQITTRRSLCVSPSSKSPNFFRHHATRNDIRCFHYTSIPLKSFFTDLSFILIFAIPWQQTSRLHPPPVQPLVRFTAQGVSHAQYSLDSLSSVIFNSITTASQQSPNTQSAPPPSQSLRHPQILKE